jgi:hypothetical protein
MISVDETASLNYLFSVTGSLPMLVWNKLLASCAKLMRRYETRSWECSDYVANQSTPRNTALLEELIVAQLKVGMYLN